MKSIDIKLYSNNNSHMLKLKHYSTIFAVFILAACAPRISSEQAIETALADLGQQVTVQADAQATVVALHLKGTEDAQTLTPPASTTPTQTSTPTQTPLPAQTEPHGDGSYLIGPDMARGQWQTDGSGTDDCYWVARKANGIILSSYYGSANSELTLHFDQYDYQFETTSCGIWDYQGP